MAKKISIVEKQYVKEAFNKTSNTLTESLIAKANIAIDDYRRQLEILLDKVALYEKYLINTKQEEKFNEFAMSDDTYVPFP